MNLKNPFDQFVNSELKFDGIPEISCDTVHPLMDALLLAMDEECIKEIDPLIKQLCSCLPVPVLQVNLEDELEAAKLNEKGQLVITVTVDHMHSMLSEIAMLATYLAPMLPHLWKMHYEGKKLGEDDTDDATPPF